jgi:hypothetical protein
MRLTLLGAALMFLGLAKSETARAQDPPDQCPCWFHRHHVEGTPPPGRPRAIPHTDERAGCPRALARHVEPSVTPGGIGYYVGGGVPFHRGQPPRDRDDGTWGWDETGLHVLRRRTILGWSHGRRYQGGTGAYRTDGPVVPDLIYATTVTVGRLGRRGAGD